MENKPKEMQVMCEKCGRNQDMLNMGDEETPIWFYPIHKVIKGNGSSKVIVCKNSGNELKN